MYVYINTEQHVYHPVIIPLVSYRSNPIAHFPFHALVCDDVIIVYWNTHLMFHFTYISVLTSQKTNAFSMFASFGLTLSCRVGAMWTWMTWGHTGGTNRTFLAFISPTFLSWLHKKQMLSPCVHPLGFHYCAGLEPCEHVWLEDALEMQTEHLFFFDVTTEMLP